MDNIVIRLHEKDNVAVALRNIKSGEMISVPGQMEKLEAVKSIPYGHKIAIAPIVEGAVVTKYGECMGIATENIPVGSYVHISNVRGLNDEERLTIIEELIQV
jgi:altronate dehydratase small subunit